MCELKNLEQQILEADEGLLKEKGRQKEEEIRLFMRNFIKENSPEFLPLVKGSGPVTALKEPKVVIFGVDDHS
jgi:hypothetical protein